MREKNINDFPGFINRFHKIDLSASQDELHVLSGKEGQVGFFKISKGNGVPPHSHDDSWATLIKGKMSIRIDRDTITVSRGDSWFVPGGIVHQGKALEDCLMVEVFCEQRFDVE